MAAIEDVAEVNPRIEKSVIADDLPVSFVPMPAVGAGDGSIVVSETRPAREVKKGFTAFQTGDVLFAKITPCMENGKMAVVPELIGGCGFGSTEFHVLRPRPGIAAKFLYYFVSSRAFRAAAEREMTGAVGQKRVPTAYLRRCGIPVVPEAQQNRIVAEIEKQFSRLDEAVANLKRVQANLKRYKAAVLKAAVEGKLTEEWRKQHPDVEPADRLLERIGDYALRPLRDEARLPDLPETWTWVRIEDLGKIQLGRQRSPKYHSGPHMRPYLRVQNVFEDRIDLGDVMEMDFPPSDFEKYRLEPGDILLNEGQSPELLGRPAMYRGELPGACFTNTLIRFRAQPPLTPEFPLLVFRAYLRSGRFQREGTITTNIAHLSAGRFSSIEFPLPPLAEQAEIVKAAQRQLSVLEALEEELCRGFKRADRLRQSILQKAFSGHLVPQDPNDEPASVLLERIRAERAKGRAGLAPSRKAEAVKARREAPKKEPAGQAPPRARPTDGDASVAAAILGFLQPGQEYSRADVVDALGLTVGQWNVGIRELKESGAVVQTGERRGARYRSTTSRDGSTPRTPGGH